jgi:RimJ/RimL family protein N-acetyltransferase
MNLLIRRYRLDDAEAVFEAARESLTELAPWMPWAHPRYSIAESRAWLEVQVPAFDQRMAFEFAIVSEEGRLLGGCGLNQLDALNRRANLGYWVRTSVSSQGVATAAVRRLREWAFDRTDLIRLEILIAADNHASQRVAEKAGATREGVLRHRLLLHGVAHDATLFAFTKA